jgi:hypothetical protein
MLGGDAAAAAANLVPAGAAHAQETAYQDGFNKLATEDGLPHQEIASLGTRDYPTLTA